MRVWWAVAILAVVSAQAGIKPSFVPISEPKRPVVYEAHAPTPDVTYEWSRDGRWVARRKADCLAYPYRDTRIGLPPPRFSPERWHAMDATIRAAAERYGLDPVLLKAILWVESRFAPAAVSHKGARGIGQLMPGTAKMLGVKNPEDPWECIWGAAAHLRRTADLFKTQNMVILAAGYNSGDGAVKGALKRAKSENDNRLMQLIPRNKETPKYVEDVLWVFDRIHRGLGGEAR